MRLRLRDLAAAVVVAALLGGCSHAPSAPSGAKRDAGERHDVVARYAGLRVNVVAEPIYRHRRALSHDEKVRGNPPVEAMIGCADVYEYADIGLRYPSSQVLLSNMVAGVCGTYNLFTMKFFGGMCTAACSNSGDWCDALAKGEIVDSSDACNACATSYPPTGPMDRVLDCGNDPLN